MNIIYTGIFFEKMTGKLEKQIEFPHVTHEFRPMNINEDLFGQEVTFEIIGYGIDTENEGYLVKVKTATDEMRKALDIIAIPHITLSVSKNGKPVNTKNLEFKPCAGFEITGVYGGFNGNKIIKNNF